MKRELTICAVLLLCAAGARAASGGDCEGVICYWSLAACQSGVAGAAEASSRTECAQGFFRCASDPSSPCRDTKTGEVVSIRDNDCHHGIRCFDTLSECYAATAADPWTLGAHPRTVCEPHGVFQCREDQRCRDVSSGYQIRQGAGVQDPHFRGFDGAAFYFGGDAGGVYNIISDTYLQVNAKFIALNELKGTYMGQIGFLLGSESLIFDPHFGVVVNGSLLVDGERTFDNGGAMRIEVVDQRFRMTVQYGAYSIQARVQVEQGMRPAAYTNLLVNLLSEPTNPHGILGQTIHGRNGLEGEEEDYRVHDGLLGTDFRFNRYVGDMARYAASSI